MEKVLKIILIGAIISASLFSCGDASKKVDDRIETLIKKTETLDSILNKEVEKASALDSLIEKEYQKVIKLDSLIEKSSSRFDSVLNKFIKSEN